MMYITKVRLKDVRCFGDVVIDLSKSEPGTSVLIAGNNGLGKSAILRAIGMGLCDHDSAASLLRELEGDFVRKQAEEKRTVREGERHAEIEIDLVDQHARLWTITTTVTEWKELIIDTVDQTYCLDGKKQQFKTFNSFWNGLFVAAYGAGLRTTGTAKFSDYFTPDAVYSLFKYDAPLQDPEIAWRRLIAASRRASKRRKKITAAQVDRNISELLKYVLDLDHLDPNAQILLEPNGIYIKANNELIPLDAMGDGHKSLVKVTLDILVWYLLKINYDKMEKGEDRDWIPISIDQEGRPAVQGIVIIDEIEQHLHPKLQRQILKRLYEKFPNVQFIMTTHSPLCVSGTADVIEDKKEKYKVFSVFKPQKGNVSVELRPVPYGLTADQVLVDYFELPTTLNVTLEDDYRRLRELLLNEKRTSTEEKEFRALRNKIAKIAPGLGETIKEREMFISMKRATEDIAQYMKKSTHDKDQ